MKTTVLESMCTLSYFRLDSLTSMQCCYRTAMAGGAALLDIIWVWPKNDETAARRTRLSIQRPGDVLHESLSAVDEVETEQAKQNHGCSC